MSTPTLQSSLTFPSGARVKNRLMKSAMSEGLATWDNRMTDALIRLYARWADGGVGLLMTGNVMIDRRALGEPGNLVIEDERDLEMLQEWATAGSRNNTSFWMQINHPGKQAIRSLNTVAYAPSAIPFAKDMRAFFAPPKELSDVEIEDLIERFGRTAGIAKKVGFAGVQIHGAHGYLVSQFLSPKHNQRNDAWGGTAEKRRRFVLEVYRAMRREVGEEFPVGIKLNSADFQRGGFSENESLELIEALSDAGIDLIEISGGTYEAPIMMTADHNRQKASTRAREAYFLDFAERARNATQTPLVVTGGFRTAQGMQDALTSGAIDVVGLGRLLAVEPDAPLRILQNQNPIHHVKPIRTGIKMVDQRALMEIMWYGRQMRRMGNGEEPKPNESALKSFAFTLMEEGWGIFASRRAR